jgi:dTDP-4-dehydrorhamnose reductase
MILVTGASGLLGANFVLAARRRRLDIVATFRRHPVQFPHTKGVALDLTNRDRVGETIASLRPTWILHSAAATDVDWCEEHPDDARRINAEASRYLAAAAREASARFVFISTDSVFDGRRGSYREEDPPAPVNVYGSTKWAGEQAIQKELPSSLVVRTNIYGWNLQPKESLAEWILNRLEAGKNVPGFDDVVFTPILVDDLCELLLDMMDRSMNGLYHVVGSEPLTKFEFAKRVAHMFGRESESIVPTKLADSGLRAPRPRNTALQTRKASRALGRDMPGVDDGLQRFKADRDSGYVKELRSCRGA